MPGGKTMDPEEWIAMKRAAGYQIDDPIERRQCARENTGEMVEMPPKVPDSATPVRTTKKGQKRRKTKAEIAQERKAFIRAAKACGLPEPEPEFRFHPTRLWRFDWVWHQGSWGGVAVEIQGGLFVQGRHNRGAALVEEYEKIREAQILGYKVMPVTPKQVESGEVFAIVRRAMGR